MSLRDRFPRRPSLPADVAAHVGLERREKVLATADLDDETTAVATVGRLLVADARERHQALAWHEVDTAVWDPEARALDVQLVEGSHLRLRMTGDARTLLPEVVRERVQSSVVLTRHVQVRGKRGVRVVVRRGPDGLLTQVVPDAGISLEDPGVAEQVGRARREVEVAAGLDSGL